MAKNLREKLSIILDDCERLSKAEKINLLERFIKEELHFLDIEHDINAHDISTIKSHAMIEFNNMRLDKEALGPIYSDMDEVRTLCFVNAVITYLRSQKLINFLLRYIKKR